MKAGINHFLVVLALGASAGLTVSNAQADQIKSSHASGMCLGNSGGRAVLTNCSNAPDIQVSGGEIKANGQCLNGSGSGSDLSWTGCNKSRAQVWSLSGELKNSEGWCADISGESRNAGAKIITFKCGSADHNSKSNQQWAKATTQSASPVAAPSIASGKKTLADVKMMVRPGQKMNLVEAQGIVAQGGGNFTLQDVAGIVAQGGGNLISNDGASLRPDMIRGNSIISTNGSGARK